MRFQCSFCLYVLRDIGLAALGQKVQCPNCGHMPVIPANAFGEGRVIGDFIIKCKIGSGSIGTVYLAQQISLDRSVALKILSRQYTNEKGIAAFLSEARTAAKLNHPNIVQVFAVGEEKGICFMAMNYIEGKTLKTKLAEEKKLYIDEALHITQQVAEALYFAWEEAKLIHRDVKPENIMINSEGVAILTDLGLAIHQKECQKGMDISGTPSYMGPEQFAGEKLDTRSDIYSLGITLYQMLSGNLPFEGQTLNTVAKQHFYESPKPLAKIIPFIPVAVSSFVDKMIAKHPNDRFQNMDELLRQLWKIRQKTAPDKDMVPDVHTISIKKLNYRVQKEKKEKDVQGIQDAVNEKNKSEKRTFITVIIFLVVVLVGLFWIIIYFSGQREIKRKLGYVAAFESEIKNPDVSLVSLEEKCKETIAKFDKVKNDSDKFLVMKLKYYLSEINYKKLLKEKEELTSKINTLAEENNQKLKDTLNLNLKKDNQLSFMEQKEKELNDKINMLQKMVDMLKKENSRLLKDLKESRAIQDSLKNEYDNQRLDDIRAKLFSLIGQSRFSDAIIFLKSTAEDENENFSEKLALILKKVDRMQKIYNIMMTSGSKYTDVQINEGRIIKIMNGQVDLKDSNGVSINKKWNNLPVDSLYSIVSDEIKDADENTVKAEIALMAGRLGEAVKYQPDDNEIASICNSACKASAEMIKLQAASDKKKAAVKAQLFMKDFEGVPDFQKYKTEMEIIIGKPEPASPVTITPPGL